MASKFIGLDFDATVVKNKYPEIGEEIDGALEVIEELQQAGHKIILYTMRSGERLEQAVEYLNENGVELYAINNNPTQHHWTESKKIFCHAVIDDCAIGCPLITDDGKPYVDWEEVRDILVEKGLI